MAPSPSAYAQRGGDRAWLPYWPSVKIALPFYCKLRVPPRLDGSPIALSEVGAEMRAIQLAQSIDRGLRRSIAWHPWHRNYRSRGHVTMRALLTLFIYLAPFLLIGAIAGIWMKWRDLGLADVQAEGKPNRLRFLLGIWRKEDREYANRRYL